MAAFAILKKILCHLFCLAGNCDLNDRRSQTTDEREADIKAFLAKGSQAETAKSLRRTDRIKRKPVRTPPAVLPKSTKKQVTDAGHHEVKPLPATPYPSSATTPPANTKVTTSRQVSKLLLLRPYLSRQYSSPKLSHSAMSLSTLKKTLDTLHLILAHTRYMVTGTAAMSVWGYSASHARRCLPRQVSILCTTDDLAIITSWAASNPHSMVFPGQTDMIGLVIDGKVRGVKIRTVSRKTFEKVERVSPTEMNKRERFKGWRENIMRTGACVLGLGPMLDLLAGDWLAYYTKDDKTKKENKLKRCGLWILWILGRFKEDSHHGRLPDYDLNNSRVAKEEFWVPFTAVWPESVLLLMKLDLLRNSANEDALRQRKVWTGKRWLVVTSVAYDEGKGKGKEEHLSLSTLASSNGRPGSEELEEWAMPVTRLNPDLARFHPYSFRVRAGLRDGSVSMGEYAALVAAQPEVGQGPGRSKTI